MTEYRESAHAVWDIKYHLIWITKYRYKVLRGEVAERARDLLREICAAREVQIVRGAVSPDHIHMLVVARPVVVQRRGGASTCVVATLFMESLALKVSPRSPSSPVITSS